MIAGITESTPPPPEPDFTRPKKTVKKARASANSAEAARKLESRYDKLMGDSVEEQEEEIEELERSELPTAVDGRLKKPLIECEK